MLDRINDPLYGLIKIEPTESKIINSPLFQRLRDIKQLGMAYYIYPTATHNRFSHSLGVMHLANKILSILHEKDSNSFEDFDMVLKNIRMAALLHDIGHFPFSHTLELSEEDHQDNNLVKCLFEGHEKLATYLIKNSYISDVLEEDNDYNNELICGLITRVTPENLVLQNIINWELDADRLDFLLRDSYFTGVKFGSLDYIYLIENFRISEVDNKALIVVDEKAGRSIENILIARYSLYNRVYTHRTISYYDFLLKNIFLKHIDEIIPEYLKNEENFKEILESEEESIKFLDFSDSFILRKIFEKYKELKNSSTNCENLKLDLNSLLFRKKNDEIWSRNWGTRLKELDYSLRLEKIEQIVDHFKASSNSTDGDIYLNIPKNIFTKYRSPNYSVFGFEFTNLEAIKEETYDSLWILEKSGEKRLFFEWGETYFKDIFDYKNIKVNIYIKNHKENLLKNFKENFESEILTYLND